MKCLAAIKLHPTSSNTIFFLFLKFSKFEDVQEDVQHFIHHHKNWKVGWNLGLDCLSL